MSYFKEIKINDYIYQFKDALGSLITLVIGESKALVFDTGYGLGDLYHLVRKYTDKELIVINSHGHMDHSCGNFQFEKVYIHKDDFELFKRHNSIERKLKNLENAKNINVEIETNKDKYLEDTTKNTYILDFDTFDLGGIKALIYDIKGHTKGSIAIYLENKKILLASDAGCAFVWLFLKESLPVKDHINSLRNILKLDFDYFLVGHVAGLIEKNKLVERKHVCENIKMEESKRVYFKDFEDLNAYAYPKDDLYVQGKCGVVFDPERL